MRLKSSGQSETKSCHSDPDSHVIFYIFENSSIHWCISTRTRSWGAWGDIRRTNRTRVKISRFISIACPDSISCKFSRWNCQYWKIISVVSKIIISNIGVINNKWGTYTRRYSLPIGLISIYSTIQCNCRSLNGCTFSLPENKIKLIDFACSFDEVIDIIRGRPSVRSSCRHNCCRTTRKYL